MKWCDVIRSAGCLFYFGGSEGHWAGGWLELRPGWKKQSAVATWRVGPSPMAEGQWSPWFLLLEISCPGPHQSQSRPRGAHHQYLSSAQCTSEGRSRNMEQTFWKISGQLGETGKLPELLSRGPVLGLMDVMMETGREDGEKLQWISSTGPGPRFLTHRFWWMQTYSGQSRISKFIKLWLKGIKNEEMPPGCSSEGMMLKLKLQYFGHLMQSELQELVMDREAWHAVIHKSRTWLSDWTELNVSSMLCHHSLSLHQALLFSFWILITFVNYLQSFKKQQGVK